MQNSKAVTYERHGPPGEVLGITEISVTEPQADEALVRMLAAPINPVDLNKIEGKYPVRPPLPAVAGVEGVGKVIALGADARGILREGARVIVPHDFGSWCELGVVAAEKLVVIPDETPIEQAAMLRINPPTAWRMLHDFVELKTGEWILQNAANSGVGLSVIEIAKVRGLHTVNFVRRPELVEELRAAGADVVLLDDDENARSIREATGGADIRLALNAVGGESALRLANALAPGGTIVTYGAMGRQPLRIPNGLLIFKDIRWRGFWVTQWYRDASRDDIQHMFKHLLPLAARGVLHAKIERTYPINEALAAVAHAQQNRRAGKILLKMASLT